MVPMVPDQFRREALVGCASASGAGSTGVRMAEL